jgi:uncharacterized membrane protein YkvA (DUF1232 family)
VTWREWARGLRRETYALYLAYRDPRAPWYARAWAIVVAAYAFSPIDLIPDPIPILGYLDDLIIVPLGVAIAIKLIPPEVMAECRREAEALMAEGKPPNWVAAAAVLAIWLTAALALGSILLF